MFGLALPSLYWLFVVLIIFGAGKLPEIGSGMGKVVKNFKRLLFLKERSEDLLGEAFQAIRPAVNSLT